MEDEKTLSKKEKKPSMNKVSCLICQKELKGKNVSNICNFPHCFCKSE